MGWEFQQSQDTFFWEWSLTQLSFLLPWWCFGEFSRGGMNSGTCHQSGHPRNEQMREICMNLDDPCVNTARLRDERLHEAFNIEVYVEKKAVWGTTPPAMEGCRRLVNPDRWFARAVWDGTPGWGRVLINFSSGADWGQKCGMNHRGQQRSASLLARPRSQCDRQRAGRSIIKRGWKGNRGSIRRHWRFCALTPDGLVAPTSGPSALALWVQIQKVLQSMWRLSQSVGIQFAPENHKQREAERLSNAGAYKGAFSRSLMTI